jgi:hypothetical protein
MIIKSFVTAAAITIGLAGYAFAQEAAPAGAAPAEPAMHYHMHTHHVYHHAPKKTYHHVHYHMHHHVHYHMHEMAPGYGAPAGAAPANPQ